MDTTRIPVETAENVKKFAGAGNVVICASHLPVESCGLLNAEENDAKVRSIMSGLVESGKLHMTDNKFEALMSKLKELVVPDLSISEGAEDIAYIHKTAEDCDIYFLEQKNRIFQPLGSLLFLKSSTLYSFHSCRIGRRFRS